jgi:hypothetical protein
VAAYVGLITGLFVSPAGALFAFFKVIVPVLPLVFFVAPGLWRNICPLAAVNQAPRVFGWPIHATVLILTLIWIMRTYAAGRRIDQEASARLGLVQVGRAAARALATRAKHSFVQVRFALDDTAVDVDVGTSLLVAACLNTALDIEGPSGRRTVTAREFFTGSMTTVLRPDELLLGVCFPVAGPGEGFAFAEKARRHGDFALSGVAIRVRRSPSGEILDATLAAFGVSGCPVVRDVARAHVMLGRIRCDPRTAPTSRPGACADPRCRRWPPS